MIEQDLMTNMFKHLKPALAHDRDVAEVIDDTLECCDMPEKVADDVLGDDPDNVKFDCANCHAEFWANKDTATCPVCHKSGGVVGSGNRIHYPDRTLGHAAAEVFDASKVVR